MDVNIAVFTVLFVVFFIVDNVPRGALYQRPRLLSTLLLSAPKDLFLEFPFHCISICRILEVNDPEQIPDRFTALAISFLSVGLYFKVRERHALKHKISAAVRKLSQKLNWWLLYQVLSTETVIFVLATALFAYEATCASRDYPPIPLCYDWSFARLVYSLHDALILVHIAYLRIFLCHVFPPFHQPCSAKPRPSNPQKPEPADKSATQNSPPGTNKAGAQHRPGQPWDHVNNLIRKWRHSAHTPEEAARRLLLVQCFKNVWDESLKNPPKLAEDIKLRHTLVRIGNEMTEDSIEVFLRTTTAALQGMLLRDALFKSNPRLAILGNGRHTMLVISGWLLESTPDREESMRRAAVLHKVIEVWHCVLQPGLSTLAQAVALNVLRRQFNSPAVSEASTIEVLLTESVKVMHMISIQRERMHLEILERQRARVLDLQMEIRRRRAEGRQAVRSLKSRLVCPWIDASLAFSTRTQPLMRGHRRVFDDRSSRCRRG